VFACFSAAALLSPRRHYLYLGGLLSSVLSFFLLARLGTWVFGGAALLFQAELYLGLAVFAGYVVFDTQASRWGRGATGQPAGCAASRPACSPRDAPPRSAAQRC
jgi:hypothetical protein